MTKARTVADVIRYLCPQRADVTGEGAVRRATGTD